MYTTNNDAIVTRIIDEMFWEEEDKGSTVHTNVMRLFKSSLEYNEEFTDGHNADLNGFSVIVKNHN